MIEDEYDRIYSLCRSLLGLTFIVFGINGLFNLAMLPMPEVDGFKFIKAIEETGYIFPFLSSYLEFQTHNVASLFQFL